jgi:hypothetical protein
VTTLAKKKCILCPNQAARSQDLCVKHCNEERAKKTGRYCSFLECGKPLFAKGFCGAHYRQYNLGETLRPLRGTPQREYLKRNAEGHRQCTVCKQHRPEVEFHQTGKGSGKLRGHCMRCNIVRRMSITANEYDAMLETQGGVCAICARPPLGKSLGVDHDHACCPGAGSCGKCIRGLLCDDCNNGIGRFSDDIDRLKRAIDYLSK